MRPVQTPADPAALTVPALALTLERVRRTTHVDALGGADGSLQVLGAARDLVRDRNAARPVRAARLRATLDARRRLADVDPDPLSAAVTGLVGATVGPGFRARAAAVLGEWVGLPLGVLVADLPVASLLSGYAQVREALEAGVAPGTVVGPGVLEVMTDVCAGWAGQSSNVASIAAGKGVPAESILGAPQAPPLQHPEYPLAWHELSELAAGGIRRARRMDVAQVRGEVVVDAFFRDTYAGMSGREVVLHEYSLYAWFDEDLTLLEVQASPRVLPFPECPAAADEVNALLGATVHDVADAVREKLDGAAGCTHLNDLLAQLAHVPRLLELLPRGEA